MPKAIFYTKPTIWINAPMTIDIAQISRVGFISLNLFAQFNSPSGELSQNGNHDYG